MSTYQDEIIAELTRKAYKVRDCMEALELLYICDPYTAEKYDAIGVSNMSEATTRKMFRDAAKYGFTL